nr:uncharacterized protein LOC109150426 [Ipomoea trifida]
MSNGCYTKYFQKKFVNTSNLDDDGYLVYKRRDAGWCVMKIRVELDNRYVVSHNSYLMMKYRAHIIQGKEYFEDDDVLDMLAIGKRIFVAWIGKVESRQSVFNRLGASPKEDKRKSVYERLGPVAIIKKHTKSPLGTESSKEIKSAVPSRMTREADVNVLCGEVLKVRPKIIVHTFVQEENEESMESSYATYQNGQDVKAAQELRRKHFIILFLVCQIGRSLQVGLRWCEQRSVSTTGSFGDLSAVQQRLAMTIGRISAMQTNGDGGYNPVGSNDLCRQTPMVSMANGSG